MPVNWIPVEDVFPICDGQWRGSVKFTGKQQIEKILIYNFDDQFRAIARFCPHKDYDLMGTQPTTAGLIRCGWHGMAFGLLDDGCSYKVKRDGEQFYCAEEDRMSIPPTSSKD